MAGLDLWDLEAAGLTGELDAEPAPPPSSSSAPVAVAALTQAVTVTMDDGTTYTATLDARDRRAYALNADRYKLPPFTIDAGHPDLLLLELLTAFGAWHATRYRLRAHTMDWPTFCAHAVDVEAAPPGTSRDPVPHPPARGAG